MDYRLVIALIAVVITIAIMWTFPLVFPAVH